MMKVSDAMTPKNSKAQNSKTHPAHVLKEFKKRGVGSPYSPTIATNCCVTASMASDCADIDELAVALC